MFADLVPQPRTLARAALTVAYLGLMLVMTVVAWEGGKVDLSSVGQVFGALGAGLLGAVINPSGSKKSAAASGTDGSGSSGSSGSSGAAESAGDAVDGERETDAFWAIQTVVGAGALLLIALALAVDGTGHPNASAAFVAVAAAFGALFVDTSGVTHPLTDAAPAAGSHTSGTVSDPASNAPGAGDGGSGTAAGPTNGPAAAPGEAPAVAPSGGDAPTGDAPTDDAPTGGAAPTGKAHIPAQSTGSADDAESPNS